MKKKILILERNEDILELVSYVLKDEGYNVKGLSTEKRIWEEIEDYKPNVILLDIIKPSEEGTKVCTMLKKNIETKHIPIIVFSTHPKVLTTIKEVCADEVIPKPFNISELVNAVEMQLA